jgi:hypothetical protein
VLFQSKFLTLQQHLCPLEEESLAFRHFGVRVFLVTFVLLFLEMEHPVEQDSGVLLLRLFVVLLLPVPLPLFVVLLLPLPLPLFVVSILNLRLETLYDMWIK